MDIHKMTPRQLVEEIPSILQALGSRLIALSATRLEEDHCKALSNAGAAMLRAARAYERHLGEDPTWAIE